MLNTPRLVSLRLTVSTRSTVLACGILAKVDRCKSRRLAGTSSQKEQTSTVVFLK